MSETPVSSMRKLAKHSPLAHICNYLRIFFSTDGPVPAVPSEYVDAIPPPVLNDGGSPSKNPLPPPDMFQDDGKSAAAAGDFWKNFCIDKPRSNGFFFPATHFLSGFPLQP